MKQDVYTSEAQLQAMLDELEHAHDLDSKAHTRIARRKLVIWQACLSLPFCLSHGCRWRMQEAGERYRLYAVIRYMK